MTIKTPAQPKEGGMARLKKQIGICKLDTEQHKNKTLLGSGTEMSEIWMKMPLKLRPEDSSEELTRKWLKNKTPLKTRSGSWRSCRFQGRKNPPTPEKKVWICLIHLPRAFSSQNWKSESRSKDVEQLPSVEALGPCSHWVSPTSLSLSFLQSKSRAGNETENTKDEFLWRDERTMGCTCTLITLVHSSDNNF